MSKPEALFWDTCVITSFLTNDELDTDLPSVEQFLRDCRGGKTLIYTSTISTAEILPSRIKHPVYSSYDDFLNDLDGSVIPISPDPNIMRMAARLRDLSYQKQATKLQVAVPKLNVPDAIILATAIILETGYKVKLDKFHTFDKGKKRSSDGPGKCVPLLSYETWCEMMNAEEKAVAQKVIDLDRCKPTHPTPELSGV